MVVHMQYDRCMASFSQIDVVKTNLLFASKDWQEAMPAQYVMK